MTAPDFRIPGEWEPQETLWTAWPSHAVYWEGAIAEARREMALFLRHLCEPASGVAAKPPRVDVWLEGDPGPVAEAVGSDRLSLQRASIGDIWLRDTGPLVGCSGAGERAFRVFRHNGWGGKFLMPGDESLAARLVAHEQLSGQFLPEVAEGGALEFNGAGLVLTTRSCLLHSNRNGPGATEAAWEARLRKSFGIEQVIWLDEGLQWDHTDGHIDNVARFVAPWTVVCQHPAGPMDPQKDRLKQVEASLQAWRSAGGRALEVITVPSPGRVEDAAGNPLPASHVNFLITNHRVLVPVYATPSEAEALETLRAIFPGREVTGLPANHILIGGGAFHCCSQQCPALC